MRKSKKMKIGKILLAVVIIGFVGYFLYDQIFAVSYPHRLCQWRCGSATTQTHGEYPTAECSGAWELEWCKCCVVQGQACQDDMTPCETIPTTTTTTNDICPTIIACLHNPTTNEYDLFSGCDYVDAMESGWVESTYEVNECPVGGSDYLWFLVGTVLVIAAIVAIAVWKKW